MSDKISKNVHNLGLPLIGRLEEVALPQLKIKKIIAKIDSGAKTSALHAVDIEYFKKGQKKMVRFRVSPDKHDKETHRLVTAKLVGERWVKSSQGLSTLRPVIQTTIEFAGEIWEIEITLVNRDMMGHRMLLGRAAIKKRFLIDVSSVFIQGKKKVKNVVTKKKPQELDKGR